MASSSFGRGCIYDVFLSFRGDTRRGFTDHLYKALTDAGVYTFRDNEELPDGEPVKPELETAIRESRISLIVFSKGYASSCWCLDELVLILQCRQFGQWVLPIFYDVEPSDARHIFNRRGAYAEAFAAHERRVRSERDHLKRIPWMQRIRDWSEALHDASNLKSMVLQNEANGHEAEFITKIVEAVLEHVPRFEQPDFVPDYSSQDDGHLVGIYPRVKHINRWVQDGSSDYLITALCGMGGIGKTTIAKFLYDSNRSMFESACFLADIRETAARPDGLVYLQKKLLSSILGRKINIVNNGDEGVEKIRRRLWGKRILLVLDDMDNPLQLEALIGSGDWLSQGSKIIISARDVQLLHGYGGLHRVHMAESLNEEESYRLFCLHAFGQNYPPEDYVEHSHALVKYCRGLPLALKVLGSSLRGRDKYSWVGAISKLRVMPERGINDILQISFDSLPTEMDKHLFLFLVCFFNGKHKDFVVTVLDECVLCTAIGLQNLKDRSLLIVNKNNKLVIHDLLRDMGREVIRREWPEEPGRRSLLWNHDDSLHVLNENLGTGAIKGLMLYTDMLAERSSRLFSSDVKLKTDAFNRMNKLQILLLNKVEFTGRLEAFPRKLVWLYWGGFPLKIIPSGYPLQSIVCLDFRHSSLKKVWNKTASLPSLKILDLRHSRNLSETPDFYLLPNLEILNLKGCATLKEIHISIGSLRRLVYLNLKGCEQLKKLPQTIVALKSLETLIISGCLNLSESPVNLNKMDSLKVLHADGVPIDRLLNISEEVKVPWYYNFSLSRESNPVQGPKCLWASLPYTLESLSLENCNLSDDAFPREFSDLPYLKHLNLSTNPLRRLPRFIRNLATLETLEFDSCWSLQSLEMLPSVQKLNVTNCTSLRKITYQSASFKPEGAMLAAECNNLVEVQNWFKVEPIEQVDVKMINALGLHDLKSLDDVEVMFSSNLLGVFYTKISHIQGVFEYGIFSTFFPGEVNPDWLEHKTSGSSISFTVPSPTSPRLRIQGLNVCSVYARAEEEHEDHRDQLHNVFYNTKSWLPHPLFVKVNNKSKGLKWIYGPSCLNIPDKNEDMIWLSHWNFGNRLEAGDEVSVSVVGDDPFPVKEFGVKIVSGEEEELEMEHNPLHPSGVYGIGGDLNEYEVRKGVYFLCNEALPRVYDSSSKVWSNYLIGDPLETTDNNEEDAVVAVNDSVTNEQQCGSWFSTIQEVLIKFLCCFLSSPPP